MSTFKNNNNKKEPIDVHSLVVFIFWTFSVLWLLTSAVLICTEINFHLIHTYSIRLCYYHAVIQKLIGSMVSHYLPF